MVRIILLWWRWGESTCAAAQATSRLWRATGTPFTTARVRFPIHCHKKKHPLWGAFSYGGGGGNRTPVRKRLNRNFSGRRRLLAFPCPGASRHAQGLGSFMIHGALKALRTHGHHSSTPPPGPWSSRVRRSLLRQREQQDCCCSLIYKLPILWMVGASARYSCLHTPVETSTPPCRQKKLASLRFRQAWRKLRIRSFLLPLQIRPAPLGSDLAVGRMALKGRGSRFCSLSSAAEADWIPYSLIGSGYSTPKVSTVTFFITCGVRGLSL